MQLSFYAVVTGFFLDLLIGDPHWMPHPVRWIGRLITFLEKNLRAMLPKIPAAQRFGGSLLALFTISISTGTGIAVLLFARGIHPLFAFLVESWFCGQLLAAKSLRKESMRVYDALKKEDLAGARQALSMIVGRDTANLDKTQTARAAVETVAENASDGEIAPLFYMMIGGLPLALFYKAVNTLDSMVGYRNERYLYFGWASARLDDLLNFVPARLAALLMIAAAPLVGQDAKNGWRVWHRDRRNHLSPNSAQTESVCAGTLGVQLGGNGYYGGRLVEKPTLGDAIRTVQQEDIFRANQLMYAASFLGLAIFGFLRIALMR